MVKNEQKGLRIGVLWNQAAGNTSFGIETLRILRSPEIPETAIRLEPAHMGQLIS
ncbi:MAG: hypothetical protein MAG451_01219 [Anaerolineales bacterium]|nr:hypothetical protein [Anaerolineales bacterium]